MTKREWSAKEIQAVLDEHAVDMSATASRHGEYPVRVHAYPWNSAPRIEAHGADLDEAFTNLVAKLTINTCLHAS